MNPSVSVSDIGLMLRVRQGDECAFETLHGRYQHKLLTFFYGLCRDGHLANDLCQETFLRVWKVRRRYRATGSFSGYLFGIARMIWLEKRREQRKTWRLGTRYDVDDGWDVAIPASSHPDAQAVRSEVQRRIMDALEELPEEQRMVFLLRNVRGLSLEDIAAAMDCPVNTVRSRKILAVKKLRHLLGKVFEPSLDGAR